jgi:hypothetical protein
MTTICPTNPTNAFNPYADPSSLTGESLLLYCQTQLSSYDDTISGFLNEQKLNLTRKKALSGIENTLKKYVNHADQAATDDILNTFKNAINSLPAGDPVRGAIEDKLHEFTSHTVPSPVAITNMGMHAFVNPGQPAVTRTSWGGYSAQPDPVTSAPAGNAGQAPPPGIPASTAASSNGQQIYYTSEQMTAFAGDIRSMLDNVNGNAEINMIQLQQVMSQRQTAVQLTTSLLAKLDEGTKSVVGNIGR